jgi:hypothetical protein
MHGAVLLVVTDHSDSNGGIAPCHLLDGGNHFDDIGLSGRYNRQRRYNNISENEGTPLLRDRQHDLVALAGLTRPSLVTRR